MNSSSPIKSTLPPVQFWFMRHGETDWNTQHRIQGHTDTPLNANGLTQAQRAALLIGQLPITHIISSPLQRAAVTAGIVQAHTGLPLTHDDRLKERAFGAFEGQFRKDILERHGRATHETYHDILPPDSESADALMHRIGHVVGDYLQSHSQHNLLFVGHGAFMAHLCGLVGLDSAKRFENATPYHFRPLGLGWVLERVEAD